MKVFCRYLSGKALNKKGYHVKYKNYNRFGEKNGYHVKIKINNSGLVRKICLARTFTQPSEA